MHQDSEPCGRAASWLNRWFTNAVGLLRRAGRAKVDHGPSLPRVEALDERVMLSVTAKFTQADGQLQVIGDAQDNAIVVSRDVGGTILVDGGAVPIAGGPATVANTSVIVILGQGGDDNLSLDETNGKLPGASLFGGDGNDVLIGGSSDDFADGGAGNDTILLGAGDDTFIWNTGDGSDVIEGGDGIDTVEVNGSDQAEKFAGDGVLDDLSGGLRVVFQGLGPTPFNLDIGGAENVILNANGGDDSFLAGTALARATSFTFNGGAGNDTLRLNGSSSDTPGITALGDTVELSAQAATIDRAPLAVNQVEAFAFPGGGPGGGANNALNVVGGTWHVDADTPAGTTPTVSVTVGAGAVVTFDKGQHLAGLTINGGVVKSAAAAGDSLSAGTLVIDGGGKLDLGDSDLLTTTSADTIRGYLASARTANNDWSGPGITSSVVAANPAKFSIGYAHAGDASNPFDALPAGTTLVRPTLAGDANLDGTVDFFDIAQILATRFNAGGTTASYTDGDLDFDGKVDFFDLTVVLSENFRTGETFAAAEAAAAGVATPTDASRGNDREPSPFAADAHANSLSRFSRNRRSGSWRARAIARP